MKAIEDHEPFGRLSKIEMKMKREFLTPIAVIAVVVCLTAGCKKNEAGALPPAGNRSRMSEYEQRFRSANHIMDINKRNEAMDAIARDAAKAGDTMITTRGLLMIIDRDMRNKSAAECALAVAKAGNRSSANSIANLISDMSLRDTTLAKLAGK